MPGVGVTRSRRIDSGEEIIPKNSWAVISSGVSGLVGIKGATWREGLGFRVNICAEILGSYR